jgi:transposase
VLHLLLDSCLWVLLLGISPLKPARPAYHPSTLLMIYIYGYLNRIHSSRRLEHETQRNVELIWLTGRLTPDFKTIADFRKNNGKAIRNACQKFILICRELQLFSQSIITIDGSKFKAVSHFILRVLRRKWLLVTYLLSFLVAEKKVVYFMK